MADFVKAYKSKYNEEPSYHSAGGYVSGLLIEQAIRQAGSTATDKVKAALDQMDIDTFYGNIKFDISPGEHGLQVGHDMVYVQWMKEGGKFEKEDRLAPRCQDQECDPLLYGQETPPRQVERHCIV